MSASDVGRVIIFFFMASVALLFSIRMWIRAYKESGPFKFPPHWYHVVAAYLSSWVVVGYGTALRIALEDYATDHSRWMLGVFYIGYAFIVTVIALYYWIKPEVLVVPPPAPIDRYGREKS